MPDSQRPKVFITHSWRDIEFARRLHYDLKAQGFEVWFDDKTLQAGHRLAEEISRALEWCDVYIPVLSPGALVSEWCWEEINAAIALSNKAGRNKRPNIIPVIAEDCDIPALLASRLYINCAGRYEQGLQELVEKGFNRRIERTSLPQVRLAPRVPATYLIAGAAAIILLILCGGITFVLWKLLPGQPTPTVISFIVSPTPPPSWPPPSMLPPTIIPAPISTASPTVTLTPTSTPSRSIPPSSALFEDTFDGSALDNSKWARENNQDNVVDANNGTLRMSSTGTMFPYVYTRANPFPATGNFRFTLRFRYTKIGSCGAPIALTSFFIPPGLSQDETNNISKSGEANGISIWLWHEVIFYRSGSERPNIPLPDPFTAWHDVTTEYVAGKYEITVDRNLLFTSSATVARPRFIFFGHPADVGSGAKGCPWDSIEIEYVRVESLP